MADNKKVAEENLSAMRGYLDRKDYKSALSCARNVQSLLATDSKLKDEANKIVIALIGGNYQDAYKKSGALIAKLR